MGVMGSWSAGQQKRQAAGASGALCSSSIRQRGALGSGGLSSGNLCSSSSVGQRERESGRSVGQ